MRILHLGLLVYTLGACAVDGQRVEGVDAARDASPVDTGSIEDGEAPGAGPAPCILGAPPRRLELEKWPDNTKLRVLDIGPAWDDQVAVLVAAENDESFGFSAVIYVVSAAGGVLQRIPLRFEPEGFPLGVMQWSVDRVDGRLLNDGERLHAVVFEEGGADAGVAVVTAQNAEGEVEPFYNENYDPDDQESGNPLWHPLAVILDDVPYLLTGAVTGRDLSTVTVRIHDLRYRRSTPPDPVRTIRIDRRTTLGRVQPFIFEGLPWVSWVEDAAEQCRHETCPAEWWMSPLEDGAEALRVDTVGYPAYQEILRQEGAPYISFHPWQSGLLVSIDEGLPSVGRAYSALATGPEGRPRLEARAELPEGVYPYTTSPFLGSNDAYLAIDQGPSEGCRFEETCRRFAVKPLHALEGHTVGDFAAPRMGSVSVLSTSSGFWASALDADRPSPLAEVDQLEAPTVQLLHFPCSDEAAGAR